MASFDTFDRRVHGSSLKFAAIAAALSLVAGCAESPEPELIEHQDEAMHAKTSGQIVVDWNATAFDVAHRVDKYQDLFVHLRAITMMHLAIHDAVNGVHAKYDRYALSRSDWRADPVTAAAAAAHGVLSAVYPNERGFLDERLEQSLNRNRRGTKNRSIALGKAAAEAVLAARANDGSELTEPYTPSNEPGRYQFVPPFDFIYRPSWRNVEPFALDVTSQFRVEPPPPLGSTEYAQAYDEVRAYGRTSDSTRTPEQTFYADWWYELSDIGWNRITRATWPKQPHRDLFFTARLFALVNVGLIDAYLAGWDSKLHYDFWRPYTAIRAGDTDGNAATVPESDWQPYCVTPPIQDYPSTHSALGAAGATILRRLYGRDVPFEMESTSSKPAGEKRAFSSFHKAAVENADSRVACGIHFRFATRAGLELGNEIGAHATESLLRPTRRHP